ncbi:flagellar hook protein FlgE [Halomonas organivorans]|uniref:Flagellar hook protein FlgE n=1 Tax=Halomonas organivorans TaxID=257772 RepID=A0A7W5BY55_9GAMM|nr:flagellar hook protein FlgE [Halomonas organivorans]MBB3140353.1 flagellar hook protein FlgE [Halomonas organivorans]
MGFSQALSGLNAASSSLDVLGNNIANSQTVGYKGSSVQFADVFAGSTGLGTKVANVLQDFGDGNIENTGRNLDLAISGEGFYRFQQEGEVVYSRNGQLSMTADGFLENAQGARIMGYGLSDANDPFSQVVTGGQPVPLNVPSADMPALATGTSTGDNPGVQAVYNLDASIDETDASKLNTAQVFTDATQGTSAEVSYHYSNSYTVYDSLGTAHNVTAYFTKTGANTWDVTTAINGVAGSVDAAGAVQAQGTLTFNADGTLADDTPINLAYANANDGSAQIATGADNLNFDFDLAGTTQFSNDSTNTSLTQDGYTSGALVGITIEDDGTVMRNYTNEQSMAAGQIVLANFRNPEGLEAVGDNAWKATGVSGQELVGEAGTGMLGSINSGAIETSNVDLAKQLVDMIVTQRAYQANSQTISTQDEVLQAAINLSR